MREALNYLNETKYREILADLTHGIANAVAEMHYKRVANHGPKDKKCDKDHQLVYPYFTCDEKETSLSELEAMACKPEFGNRFMAHNGWIVDHDPLINFAEDKSRAYLRRDINVWGDSVKLR